MVGNKYGILSFVIMSLVGSAANAQAESYDEQRDQNGYLGVLVGVNNATNTGQSTTPALGATGWSKTGAEFGLGIFGSYNGQTNSGSVLGLPAGTSVITTL